MLTGTVAVAVGFTSIFTTYIENSHWWTLVCYGGIIALFQIGWAVVQISHLSMIPSIALDHIHSADLTAIR